MTAARRRRWKRLRTIAFACYGIAAVIAALAVAAFVHNRHGPVNAVAPVAFPSTVPGNVARPTATTTPDGGPPETSGLFRTDPGGLNTAPIIEGPAVFTLAKKGSTPLPGLSIRDLESAHEDTPIAVLMTSPDGRMFLGDTSGLTLQNSNNSGYLPISGRVRDVNAALAQLSYTPSVQKAQKIGIIVCDLDSTGKHTKLCNGREITLTF